MNAEKDAIESILSFGNYSVINESNGKLIRDVGDGIELFESYLSNVPDHIYTSMPHAIKWFLK